MMEHLHKQSIILRHNYIVLYVNRQCKNNFSLLITTKPSPHQFAIKTPSTHIKSKIDRLATALQFPSLEVDLYLLLIIRVNDAQPYHYCLVEYKCDIVCHILLLDFMCLDNGDINEYKVYDRSWSIVVHFSSRNIYFL